MLKRFPSKLLRIVSKFLIKPLTKSLTKSLTKRSSYKKELILILLPTITVLVSLVFVNAFSRQSFLFTSLASSAFLVYTEPNSHFNQTKSLVFSHAIAGCIGYFVYQFFSSGYISAAIAMILTISLMIIFDIVHPPAISTSLGFALRHGEETDLMLFVMMIGITTLLVIMQKFTVRFLASGKTSSL